MKKSMKKWLRPILFKIGTDLISQFIEEIVSKTVEDLKKEIDSNFKEEDGREICKAGISLLSDRILLRIKEKL